MRSHFHTVWSLLLDALRECSENKVMRLAAALAYYAMFSLAPLVIVIVAILGLSIGEEAAESRATGQLRSIVGDTAASAVGRLLSSHDALGDGIGTTLIGVFGLLLGGSALFNHLRDSLNTIWEIAPRPDRGLRGMVLDRFMGLAMVLCVAFIVLLGFGLTVELSSLEPLLAGAFSGQERWYALRALQLILSGATATLIVALTYRILPDAHMAWRDIWVGASATAGLLVLSQALIGLYLRSRESTAYGTIGAMVIVLVWVYYSAMVFFFGAELTWVYANRHGSRILPADHAVSLTAGDRAAQGMLRTSEIAAVTQGRPAAPEAEREVGK